MVADAMWDNAKESRRYMLDVPLSGWNRSEQLAKFAVALKMLPPPPAKILDCGTGNGWTAAFLTMAGYEVLGTDSSEEILDIARENMKRYDVNPRIARSDFDRDNLQEEFDAVLFNAALHHTNDVKRSIELAFAHLKRGGMAIFVEPGAFHGRKKQQREFVEDHEGAIENSLPPFRTARMLKTAGFRRVRVIPNIGFQIKLYRTWFPQWLGCLCVWAYKYLDGIVVARK